MLQINKGVFLSPQWFWLSLDVLNMQNSIMFLVVLLYYQCFINLLTEIEDMYKKFEFTLYFEKCSRLYVYRKCNGATNKLIQILLLGRKWQKIDTYSNMLYLLSFVSKPLQKISVRNILHDQHNGLRPNPKTEYAKNVSMRSNVLHEVNFLKKLSFFLLSSIF